MSATELVKRARDRFSRVDGRQYLIEKYSNKLQVTYDGNLFQVSVELIAFLQLQQQDEVIILDIYSNPVKVNKAALLATMSDVYNSVLSEWYQEYTELSKLR